MEHEHNSNEQTGRLDQNSSLNLLASNTAITFARASEGMFTSARSRFLMSLIALTLLVQLTVPSCAASQSADIEPTTTPTAAIVTEAPTNTYVVPSPTIEPTSTLEPTVTVLPTEVVQETKYVTFETDYGPMTMPEVTSFQEALNLIMEHSDELGWNNDTTPKGTDADWASLKQYKTIPDHIADVNPKVVRIENPNNPDEFFKVAVWNGVEVNGVKTTLVLYFTPVPDPENNLQMHPIHVTQDQLTVLSEIAAQDYEWNLPLDSETN